MLVKNFFDIIAENSVDEPNLADIQKRIRVLSRLLKHLNDSDQRNIFRKLAMPVFDEILSWEEREQEEIKPIIFRVIEGPEPLTLPFKQYIMLAIYIGFLIGTQVIKSSDIESRFREKKFFPKSNPIVSLTSDPNYIFKADSLDFSLLVFCFIFFAISTLENKNFISLRLKLLRKALKKIVNKKRNHGNSANSPHYPFLFEAYG